MATNMELHALNRNKVYRAILKEGDTTIQNLAVQLALSYPTVRDSLAELEKRGLVLDKGEPMRTGGRRAKLVSPVLQYRLSLGLDISKNHINLVLLDLGQNVVSSLRERIPFSADEKYFQYIQKSIDAMVGDLGDKILGMTISFPGIIKDEGKSLHYAPLLGNPKRLYEALAPYIPYPYRFLNAASAGAVSEIGGEASGQDFVYLMLSNSVGGAIVLDGNVVEGKGLRSGEFGHMTLIPEGEVCYCGQRGCVDAYLSALRLSEHLESFFDGLAKGDPVCEGKWETYFTNLTVVLHNLQMGFNLPIVIGGYVGRHIEPYMDRVREAVWNRSCYQDESISLLAGRYGALASAVGGAMLLVEDFNRKV